MCDKKRLLLLGGTNCIEEIKQYASANNIKLIATGKYPDTIIKRNCEESYDIDAADVGALSNFVKEKNIDAIFTGCNEFIVPRAVTVASENNLPHYCNLQQWDICMNKEKFKNLCIKNDIPVAKQYELNELLETDYPVVVKPADSCGSQGFSICENYNEVLKAIDNAEKFSKTRSVIIEQYMPYPASIIHYTAINGEIYFCGMSDKQSVSLFGKNSSVMSLQLFPSKYLSQYISKLDKKVKAMFSSIEIQNGPIWIEAFNNEGNLYFNEMGYRFGGSMTFHPVKYFYGIDQLQLLLEYSIYGKVINDNRPVFDNTKKNYCILPLHVSKGKIKKVTGESELANIKELFKYVPIHFEGDEIKQDGTVQQVFCYLHITYENFISLKNTVKRIIDTVKVLDNDGNNMLFCLANLEEM